MEKKNKQSFSWFWKWFLNNQVVTALLIVLLVLLIINLFTRVSYLFTPVLQFLAIVGLPIILAGILYYLMNPVVDFAEKKGIRRIYSIIALFVLVIGLLAWGIIVIVPKIQEQTLSFVDNFPQYVKVVERTVNDLFSDPIFSQVQEQLTASGEKFMNSLTEVIQNVSKTTFQNLGNFFGAVASIVVAVITMPFILFYLLKDGRKLGPYVVNFLPIKLRKPTLKVLGEMNDQVSSYIRGQLTVAFAVAIMFMIGFSIIGLDYAITLGIAAGFLNLIPYLGSFLALVPAVFLGIVGGPVLLVKVLVVFVIEQTIEGRVISPLVLGSQLSIHPVTILLVLLTSGKLFGLVGVILGIPAYAAIKVVISNVFEWYKRISNLYEEETEVITKE
ncbi:AI-2E family transporter [Enterococcus saccharolyticus]|uniref:Permease n=1 Tax=Enterococcus saccharolyticus subsp. saccharolyticus ATCC 43076 TaxID=1139996 RepID=S0NVJ5_9ENTE|nr:AI-2E family transporter [Enterococcus saccharolyticus]EOT30700.1 permease [Enterococcus saccharolyticus subsp. saccharolyticus ATCC 43076]EOT80261.1 permease [Enterococcus saccharolyticus subsp. saccharolyticus ATCC 43076]OJG88889.1 permease [Enterococcus saccharolyticus]